MGSGPYSAPEQYDFNGVFDRNTDMYPVAVILYEMLVISASFAPMFMD
jgi:serine/threonine protein kinase